MNETAVFALFTVPLLSFASASIIEFRSDDQSLRSFIRVFPLSLAVALSVSLMIDVYYPYFSFHLRQTNTMSVLSLLVAVSPLVCKYKSRPAAALIFVGGLVLAVFWRLDRWVA